LLLLCAAVAASFHSVQVLKFGLSLGKSKLLLGSCTQCIIIIIIIHVCKKNRMLFYKLTPSNWPTKKRNEKKRKKRNEKEKISIHHPLGVC
jgi:hypothetical protein